MPTFNYQVKDISGKIISGKMEADNEKSVISRLRASGFHPIDIKHETSQKSLFKKISRVKLLLFTQRLSDLLIGGFPLAKSLEILYKQTEDKVMKNIISKLETDIKGGISFADALKQFPEIFSDLFIGMIKTGESTGMLDTAVLRLFDFYEKEQEIINKIKAALAYPLIMLFVGIACVIFLITFVIPKFVTMFQDIGQVLPLPTRIIIFIGNFIKDKWFIYIPVLIICIIFLLKIKLTKKGKLFFDNLKLKLPIFGALLRIELISRAIRTLSILIENGVPILDALKLTKDTIGNEVIGNEVYKIYVSVKQGTGLVEPLRKSNIFPMIVADMVAIGEETGKLAQSLKKIADSFDKKIDYSIKTITSLLEPVIILIVGLMVGFVAFSMFMPIFQMSSTIK